MMPLSIVKLAGFAALGFIAGVAYFWMLRESLRLFAAGRDRALAAAMYIIRLAAAGIIFWMIAGWGAPALLEMLLGFLSARFVSMRSILREPC